MSTIPVAWRQWNPSSNWRLIEAGALIPGDIILLAGGAVKLDHVNPEASLGPSVRVLFDPKGDGNTHWADLYTGQRVPIFVGQS